VRRVLLGALVASACVLAAGCKSDEPPPQAVTTPIRGCEAAVFGTLSRDWRKHAVIAGPLAWLGTEGYAREPARRFRERGSRYLFQKALAIVKAGALVKMVVPEGERDRLALTYGGAGHADNLYELSEGESSWKLRACNDTATQFNGGFVVAGAQCAEVDVFVEGRSEPIRAFIGFGTGAEPCPG
jgi:hypothetical protein